MADATAATKPPEPPTFPPPVKATIDWLQRSFGQYYKQNPPPLPDRFTRREFGFILWPERPGPPPFIRHRAYESRGRFLNYLGWKGPHSVYYSTAYYRRPGEMKMADKQWLGAELIFDLDADHLVEAEAAAARGTPMPLGEQLELVKGQFKRLLDEFLFGDLGVDPNEVWLTFSGGRGYHAHVVDPKLMQLDAKARREIVDYITGKFPAVRGSNAVDLSNFIHSASDYAVIRPDYQTRVGRGTARQIQTWRLPGPETAGWPGRLTRAVQEVLENEVISAPKQQARQWLLQLSGIGEKKADKFLASLTDSKIAAWQRGVINLDKDGVFDGVVKKALDGFAVPLGKGETDEPVTADVKRLIRLPGSLHGKSGLRVVTLTRDELDGFDPFRDAVAFPLDPVRFVSRADNEATLAGETVRVKGGEETEVPMVHAVWMAARQQGTVVV